MAIYLSALFMSVLNGAISCESCSDESDAVMDALDLCNHNFINRWDDMNYSEASARMVQKELRDFYDVAREYNAALPFPLRFFVKKALLDAGEKVKADEWQLTGSYKAEALL